MILGFEPRVTISNSLVISPYFSLSTGNVPSLYVYTNVIHSQYVGDVKFQLELLVKKNSMKSLLQKHLIDFITYLCVDRH